MSAEELVYHVDDDDDVVEVIRRGDLTDRALRHRSVAVLCRSAADGRILVHRRAAAKRVFPRHYDMFVAGMVPAGESYEQAAVRECGEEVGAFGVRLTPLGKYRFDHDLVPQWTCVYETVIDPDGVVPQESEVEWFAFVTGPELGAMLDSEPFCPDSRALYEHVFVLGDTTPVTRPLRD